MEEAILLAKSEQDSVGGILETAITGIPAGIGEPYFDSIESQLSHMLFSIPAVKGVEFGSGFDFAKMRGSESNDPFRIDESGKVYTKTNHNGGINGGISNGMPIIFRSAIKPTPSISIEQETVDFFKGENKDFAIKGRHDPAIIHRARVVVDSAAAIVICDILAQRSGTDWLR
jgi:chorismate synthase